MARQKLYNPRNSVSSTLTHEEQMAIANRIAAIVDTQDSLVQGNNLDGFYENLKNALMLREVLGRNIRVLEVPIGAHLDEAAAKHLSETLPLIRLDSVVERLELRIDNDIDAVEELNLSELPSSVRSLSVKFKAGTSSEVIEAFWTKIEELLDSNLTLTAIESAKTVSVPTKVTRQLNRNKTAQAGKAEVTHLINPAEQQFRITQFSEIALTSQQRLELGAEGMRQLTIGNNAAIDNHDRRISAQAEDIRGIRQDLVGINRRLSRAEDRIAAVEANQQAMGSLVVRLANTNSAISDRDIASLEAIYGAIDANSDETPARNTAEEAYKRDFKFLFKSILLDGMSRNMSSRQITSVESDGAGASLFKCLGSMAYEVAKVLPVAGIAAAAANQIYLTATAKVEEKFWRNIVDLARDGDSNYLDVLSNSLAEHYAQHMGDAIPRSTIMGSIKQGFDSLIGKGVSTGRIRELSPKALYDVEKLFTDLSKRKNMTLDSNARTVALDLYALNYAREAAEKRAELNTLRPNLVELPFGKTPAKGSPSGSDRSSDSDRTAMIDSSRSNSDETKEEKKVDGLRQVQRSNNVHSIETATRRAAAEQKMGQEQGHVAQLEQKRGFVIVKGAKISKESIREKADREQDNITIPSVHMFDVQKEEPAFAFKEYVHAKAGKEKPGMFNSQKYTKLDAKLDEQLKRLDMFYELVEERSGYSKRRDARQEVKDIYDYFAKEMKKEKYTPVIELSR